MNADGSDQTSLIHTDSNQVVWSGRAPDWSPDSAKIAFMSDRGPDRDVVSRTGAYVVPASDGEPELWSEGLASVGPLAWSPDGRRIAVVGSNDAELSAGLLLIAGLHARWVALATIPLLLGAAQAHFANGWVFSAPGGGWEFPVFLVVAAAAQVFLGNGAYALRLEKRRGLYLAALPV